MERISVDFNTSMSDQKERVLIPTHVHPELKQRINDADRVLLYEEHDYEVEAIVEYDKAHNVWLGNPDWSTFRRLRNPDAQASG